MRKYIFIKTYHVTVQKIKFPIKDFFTERDQIWSHLLKKSLLENFSFCAVCLMIILELQ